VLKNVALSAILSGMGGADRERRARKLLEVLGIGDKANFKPTTLSGASSRGSQ
jgi:predicted ABC-type transport system involved in lysophospholipase L1 biosynthesis ATPase subunit